LTLTGHSALARASYVGSARARALTQPHRLKTALNWPTLAPASGL